MSTQPLHSPPTGSLPATQVTARADQRRAFASLLWHERLVSWPAPHQLSVRLPVVGWFVAPDFGYRVGVSLQHRWCAGALGGVRVLSVAGHCDARTARRSLTLLITLAERPVPGRRLDGAQMARDVAAAVEACARRPVAS